jgi:PepSY-associated TM region
MNSLSNHLKRWLYLVHRWLGIALCVVMVAWFVSGMVMLYVGYPKLTPAERLAGVQVLPAEGCCVTLVTARAAVPPPPATPNTRRLASVDTWRLTSVAGRPRYIFGEDSRHPSAVDALTGHPVSSVTPEAALAAARHFAGEVAARPLGLVQEDAWTHSRALDGHRPLHLIEVDDEAKRWLYVSGRTGEVVRDASHVERTWGWVGAWLHWLYMFRGGALNAWWADIVIWLSIAGSVSALTGIVVGIWRWRFSGTYRSGRRTPYADRAARWHHVAGMVGGVLAFTWVLSGLFSMNPWKVFDAPGPKPDRLAYAGGALEPDLAPDPGRLLKQLAASGFSAREITWHRAGGEHLALAHGAGEPRLFATAEAQPRASVPDEVWRAAAGRLLPGARVVEQERLDQYDAHYYGREPHTMTGQRERPLPVWRLLFDDPNSTWAVIDPRTAALVQISDGHRRVDRWLFAFLHSFDLPAFLAARPAWDAWMLLFSLAGTLLAVTAVVTGTRRLVRRKRRWIAHGGGAGAMTKAHAQHMSDEWRHP